RGKHNAHNGFQALRPAFDRAQGRGRPVKGANAFSHLAASGEEVAGRFWQGEGLVRDESCWNRFAVVLHRACHVQQGLSGEAPVSTLSLAMTWQPVVLCPAANSIGVNPKQGSCLGNRQKLWLVLSHL